MNILISVGILVASYLFGSIPMGLLIVRLLTGKDVRTIASGRTGGTNVMRAAGFWAGLITALFDILKAAGAAWLAKWAVPQNEWLHALAPVAAILGHNYSIFLAERGENGRIHLRGGAGGASCAGGAAGLWPLSFFIVVPAGALILYFVGYASLATISTGIIAIVIFAIRAAMGLSPWAYVVYGVLATALLAWSLRPNFQRLIEGNERLVGFRARKKKTA